MWKDDNGDKISIDYNIPMPLHTNDFGTKPIVLKNEGITRILIIRYYRLLSFARSTEPGIYYTTGNSQVASSNYAGGIDKSTIEAFQNGKQSILKKDIHLGKCENEESRLK